MIAFRNTSLNIISDFRLLHLVIHFRSTTILSAARFDPRYLSNLRYLVFQHQHLDLANSDCAREGRGSNCLRLTVCQSDIIVDKSLNLALRPVRMPNLRCDNTVND